jgi:AraC-like DNA-binding protein/CheY-like chemotaxis protein
MYSACIADDEILIQKSISARIKASGVPVRVAGCADNAESAINLYWDSRPDIFFVDINMPGMDGLSLIRQIREEDPSCLTKFIIITGYDDFSHMREAIQSGAMDYLKKPISTGEFNSAINATLGLIQQEQRRNQGKRDGILYYDEYLSDPPQIMNSGTFMAAYGPNADAFDAVEKTIFELCKNPHEKGNKNLLCIAFQGIETARLYYTPDRQIPKHLILQNINGPARNNKMFFVFTHPAGERFDTLVERAEQSINRRFINAGIAECSPRTIIPAVDTSILDYSLEHGQTGACRSALKACFDDIFRKDPSWRELSPFYRQIALLLINKYMTHKMPIPDSLKFEFSLFALCRYPTLESLRTRLNGMILSLAQKIGGQMKNRELVQGVCEFLERNYARGLTLNDLAARFYVSPPYLSRRFKEKTGITFVEYLENIRMDKAREYLINSEAPVADISEQVGYMEPAYFTKVFKRKYKVPPSEYRLKNK